MRNRLVIPCDTMPIQVQLAKVGTALAQLNAMGFTADRIEMDGYTRPTITVRFDGYCRQRMENAEAVRYAHGFDECGRYERYQIQVENCRVSWEVR
ncbi:hypothetical protein NLN82_23350 [Citrobacter portucalensis]|uniref:hypothetical protein n=1 Tax=Citrobacter portucalensis TaxID=1639133 RepID=UPI00226BB7B0|nr:hypothetical protein [Citrobacter portucalensis]MCX9038965.1 hypothetical protein [Citrobacter portucalensis]